MILVDTSVWVRFLHGKADVSDHLEQLLDDQEVAGHEMIYGELLIGDVGGRLEILADYAHLDQCATVAHSEVVQFVRDRKLHGLGIGWTDAHLLASAVVEGSPLWTADARLANVAAQVGCGYVP
jgi:predicted nucleic acid-binding protein